MCVSQVSGWVLHPGGLQPGTSLKQAVPAKATTGSGFPNLSIKTLLRAESQRISNPKRKESVARGKSKMSLNSSLHCQIRANFDHAPVSPCVQTGAYRAWLVYSLPFKSCQQFSAPEAKALHTPERLFCFEKVIPEGPLGHRTMKHAQAQCSQGAPDAPRAVVSTSQLHP